MRRSFLLLVSLFLAAVPASARAGGKGHLVIIGGGDHAFAAMQKIVELAGGKDAPIVIVPTASEEVDSGPGYAREFKNFAGATNVRVLDVKTRADASNPEFVKAVAEARGIFYGGGDQVRLTDALHDTPLQAAIVAAWERGAVVGGTSAGAACQSKVMITGEGDFSVIRAGSVETKRGFGFVPDHVLIDQHFVVRQRENRLITVLLENPQLIGFGIDEDTALWSKPDGTMEVVGTGSVLVLDPSGAKVTRTKSPSENTSPASKNDVLGARDLRMHLLVAGDRFDPVKRTFLPK